MSLEIVMCHYVRPIQNSQYPNIKGLELNAFVRQIEYFRKNKNIISTSQVIDFFKKKSDIPKDSVWLTFDDDYKDHIKYVVPILENFDCDAIFFPVTNTFTQNIILDVNAIQFIIEKSNCENNLLLKLERELFDIGYTKRDYEKLKKETNQKKYLIQKKYLFLNFCFKKN